MVSRGDVPRSFKKVKMKYIYNFLSTFFRFLGTQNDYLYPFEGQINGESCPYKKAHWYKTRIGFNTAWRIAKSIHG